jgi:sulfite exporter TauE/SafE
VIDGLPALTLGAAFLAGLAGGVHCAAMCGPLVGIACGARSGRGGRQWLRQALAYNAGRILAYAAAGTITGALGATGLALRGEPLTQQMMLAAMSISLIVLAAYVAGLAPLVRGIEAVGAVAWRRIGPYSRRFLPASTPARALGLGLVFGWLPCGMVYVALIAALTTADPLHGALVMTAFGLGTLPNLLAIWAWFRYAAAWARGRAARMLVAAVIATVGIAGLAKAVEPATVSGNGSWCLGVPGVSAIFGAGRH